AALLPQAARAKARATRSGVRMGPPAGTAIEADHRRRCTPSFRLASEGMKARSLSFGTPELAVPIAQAGADVTGLVAVATQPDRPQGGGQRTSAPPVKRWAEERGIGVMQPLKVRDGTLAAALRPLGADVAVVAAYGRILPGELLDLPRLGCVNVHASLLPR